MENATENIAPKTVRRVDVAIASSIILGVIIVDQLIKIYVKTHFALHESVEVTPWFYLNFIENEGMAWGMSPMSTIWLTLFRVVTIGFFVWLLRKAMLNRVPKGLIICVSLIIAGAMGNIIDNCLYGLVFTQSTPFEVAQFCSFGEGYGNFLDGRVVDMFYFPRFTWPDSFPLVGGSVFFGAIFNFADAAISCATIAILIFYSRYVFSSKEYTPHGLRVAGGVLPLPDDIVQEGTP